MNQQELQQFVTPFQVNLGFVVEGDVHHITLSNTGPFDFQAYEMSCNCLGEAKLDVRQFTGKVVASSVGLQGSTYEMLQIGDRFGQIHHTAKGIRIFDPVAQRMFEESEIPSDLESLKKANVFRFHQSITLWFDDGEEFQTVSPEKQLMVNPNKNRLIVPVSFMVIKKAV